MYTSSFEASALALGYESKRLYFDEEDLDQSEVMERGVSRFSGAGSYEEYVKEKNEFLVNSITLPSNFERRKLIDFLTRKTLECPKDEKINAIKNSKKDHLHILLELLEYFIENSEKSEEFAAQRGASDFLSSDFPLSFFTNFLLLEKLENACLYFFKERITHCIRYLSAPDIKNNERRRTNLLSSMRRELDPFWKKFEDCALAKDSLIFSIVVHNADNYEDILKDKKVTSKKMDEAELKRLQFRFEKDLNEFNQMVSQAVPNQVYKELDTDSPLAIAFSTVMSSI